MAKKKALTWHGRFKWFTPDEGSIEISAPASARCSIEQMVEDVACMSLIFLGEKKARQAASKGYARAKRRKKKREAAGE